MRDVFRSAPRELRERRRRDDRLATDGGLLLRMPFTAPYDWEAILDFLAERAIPCVESVESGVYRRTIALDGAPGVLEIGPGDGRERRASTEAARSPDRRSRGGSGVLASVAGIGDDPPSYRCQLTRLS
jgi:hypothetical protein